MIAMGGPGAASSSSSSSGSSRLGALAGEGTGFAAGFGRFLTTGIEGGSSAASHVSSRTDSCGSERAAAPGPTREEGLAGVGPAVPPTFNVLIVLQAGHLILSP